MLGGGTHPRIGGSSSLDQNDLLHELDSGYSDACWGVLSVQNFQYPAFRAVQYVPLLSVVSIRTSVGEKSGGITGISTTKPFSAA